MRKKEMSNKAFDSRDVKRRAWGRPAWAAGEGKCWLLGFGEI
jgi:hypothetical protein